MAWYISSAQGGSQWTDGMSDADAAEMTKLCISLMDYMNGPGFIPKAVGFDALAVAKRNQDLYSLRHYDRLFRTMTPARDVRDAVATGKTFPNGGLPEITVEQVESHAIVANRIKGATGTITNRIKKLALTHPGQGDFIVELIAEREIGDPDQIKAILAEVKDTPAALNEGTL